MKKLLTLCLAVICVLSLTACRDLFDEPVDEKPVLYLYPTEEMEVTVTLDYDGMLSHTYPAYEGGWTVTAQPDGTLTDTSGREYYCLFWEGKGTAAYDFSRGFCVAGSDTAAPDTVLRVFMAWQPLTEAVEMEPQTLTAPARTGFTVVEWGGCQVVGD